MKDKQYFYKIDYIFRLVSFKKEITEHNILNEYKGELEDIGISDLQLTSYLEKLRSDGYVGETGGRYFVAAGGQGFYGYAHEALIEEEEKSVVDLFTRGGVLLSLFFNVLFGSTALYFNWQNSKNVEQLNVKSIQIRELATDLKLQKSIIDKLKSTNNSPNPVHIDNRKRANK